MDIVIIDTGCANLTSVQAAIHRLGYQATVSRDKQRVLQADKLFLPGVGSAGAVMRQLEQRSLINLIQCCTQPLLGICLGMQLLARHSQESGGINTLGIIEQEVVAMQSDQLPLPHMGWNKVRALAGHPLFYLIPPESYFYFVHSYALPVIADTIAHCHYTDEFSAAIARDNFYGVQFHPERSGKYGAQLLRNFLECL